jgi:uncharacterized protein (TIGR02284 family)
MEMKKPAPVPVYRDDDDKSGIRKAVDGPRSGSVAQVIDDTVTDVKESIGRVTNDPRYGEHGTEPGKPSSSYATTTTGAAAPITDGVAKLQECLRGELSAVETYDLAINSVKDAELTRALRQLRDSHDRRVVLLRDRLRQDGAKPEPSSGAWGALAKMVQGTADIFGSSAALSALEEGEDHGLKLYSADLQDCDLSTREFIVVELLPEQQRSHDLCRTLDRFVKVT